MTVCVTFALAEISLGHRRSRGGDEQSGQLTAMILASGEVDNFDFENDSELTSFLKSVAEQNGVGLSRTLALSKEVEPQSAKHNMSKLPSSVAGISQARSNLTMAISPTEKNHTRHLPVQSTSNTSLSRVGAPQLTSNMSTTGSFMEYSQNALSFWMLRKRHSIHTVSLPLAIAVWASTVLACLLCGTCCYYAASPAALDDVDFQRRGTPGDNKQPEANGTDEDVDEPPQQEVRKGMFGIPNFTMMANVFSDGAAKGDTETSEDRVARIIQESRRNGRVRTATPRMYHVGSAPE